MRPTRIRDSEMLQFNNLNKVMKLKTILKNEESSKNLVSIKMKRFFLISIILLCGIFSTFAQSTVYFVSETSWVPVPINVNNQKVIELKGELKGNKYASYHSPCKKKCTLYSEGKVIFSFDFERPNYSNSNAPFKHAGEIQVTLSENSVHYIRFKSKGWNDYTFEELSEKEGEKLFAKKKYVLTPEYIEQKNKE